jgi:thiol-disulfide isomerase/thioredoxin
VSEERAVRVLGCVGLVALSLMTAGCNAFGKKDAAGPGAADRAPTGPTLPTGPAIGKAPAQPTRAPGPPNVGGLLAGQVVDAYNRRPPPTLIQIIPSPDGGAAAGAPIEVAADSQGYFTIQGLQPGRAYQLVARSRDGERVLAGAVWAKPPKPNLLILVSEDYAGASAADRSRDPRRGRNGPAAAIERPVGAAPPASGALRGVEIGAPVRTDPAAASPAPQPVTTIQPDRFANGESLAQNQVPAAISGGPQPASIQPGPQEGGPSGLTGGPAPVPSCVLTGNKLENFALNGLDGQPWEFKKDRRGKLVLLDFWGTWCGPCHQAIRHLVALNNVYAPYGLETIGIAYEKGASAEDHARKVAGVRQRYGINYRLLLGTGYDAECPVRSQFLVQAYPTLVLLDDTGRVLWRSEGLTPEKTEELDLVLRKYLRIR